MCSMSKSIGTLNNQRPFGGTLPDDVIIDALRFLSRADLIRFSLTCRRWRDIIAKYFKCAPFVGLYGLSYALFGAVQYDVLDIHSVYNYAPERRLSAGVYRRMNESIEYCYASSYTSMYSEGPPPLGHGVRVWPGEQKGRRREELSIVIPLVDEPFRDEREVINRPPFVTFELVRVSVNVQTPLEFAPRVAEFLRGALSTPGTAQRVDVEMTVPFWKALCRYKERKLLCNCEKLFIKISARRYGMLDEASYHDLWAPPFSLLDYRKCDSVHIYSEIPPSARQIAEFMIAMLDGGCSCLNLSRATQQLYDATLSLLNTELKRLNKSKAARTKLTDREVSCQMRIDLNYRITIKRIDDGYFLQTEPYVYSRYW